MRSDEVRSDEIRDVSTPTGELWPTSECGRVGTYIRSHRLHTVHRCGLFQAANYVARGMV